MKQNITLSIDKELIRKAKVISARKMVSVSQLLSDEVSRIVAAEEGYEESRRIAQSFLEKGFHLGGAVTVKREQLHER